MLEAVIVARKRGFCVKQKDISTGKVSRFNLRIYKHIELAQSYADMLNRKKS